MKRLIITGLSGLWFVSAGPLAAESVSGVVVELYTSQGCSSCPPADEYLQDLAAEPGVIALALHVEYWDYIGWTDSFANEKFTKRQKAYAKAAGSNTIYTPQMIVGGMDRVEGSDPARVEGAIRAHQAAAAPVSLQLKREGGQVVITARSDAPLAEPVNVQLVRYDPKATVKIEYGENAGMEMDYANIVTSWTRIGEWSGQGELGLTAPAPGDDPVVVILQAEGPGKIYAAAVLK